jgi:predicted CXXCH cytochrome family protein
MRHAKLASIISALLLPLAVRASGAHDAVGCKGCHGDRAVMAGNKKVLDPVTKQPYAGSTAICLACHETAEQGGKDYAPVSQTHSHPFSLASVNPKRAKVPADLLVKGRFECMSCHDPHPSNPHYKYLRVDAGPKGENLDRFCAACHPSKAG